MRLRYTDRARGDLELSISWYEKQQYGLGMKFLHCVEKSIISIVKNPTMYRYFYLKFRGCVIRKFPFVIYYTVEGNEIIVHSIFDCRQSLKKRP